MTSYAWVGRTRAGQIVKGERAADSSEALTQALRREQILVTKVEAAQKKERRMRRVAPRSLAIFTRQFSVMIDAGLPLVQCLELLGKEEPDKRLAGAIGQVKEDVEGGASLADAMQKRPYAFDPLYTNMVAAGEAGGILDTILKRLATFIEKQAKLVSQVRSAMIYPIAVLSIAVIVVMVILWKVIPTFTALFEGLGATLPLPTRIVIWMSKKLIISMPFIVIGVVAAGYLFRRYYGTPAGRMRVDGMLLKAPLVGKIFRKIAVARFCRTLSTLIGSGVPILDGLDITAKTSGNAVIESAITQVRGKIERGETIAQPLRATGVFPPMVAQMIGAGESTGALDAMLAKIAEFYEEEVDVAIAGLLTILEPALICVLGVIVGGIVISMYLPLFNIISQLS
ncbi:MAG TPA: type II secretion system F family protein [Vicinamibacterales bacterium]|jgi:type IV pilus assembly protein PilC|nr:type II secretion system F family protein [Vicinamibacterales bacterium]